MLEPGLARAVEQAEGQRLGAGDGAVEARARSARGATWKAGSWAISAVSPNAWPAFSAATLAAATAGGP